MFTGIVEELGEVTGRDVLTDAARLTIRGPTVTGDAGQGDSIAVNGVCLTVVEVLSDGRFSADVMAETLNRSNLGSLQPGSRVNLERAAALNSRLAPPGRLFPGGLLLLPGGGPPGDARCGRPIRPLAAPRRPRRAGRADSSLRGYVDTFGASLGSSDESGRLVQSVRS